ncbi:MAG: malonate transporter subunit MadL [Kordiimonadaceae bacterium]|jgi:malonate transporter MadL subunit|nr:malonate transporter subunit MadL [Kordiimonadaceae bacterium]MBT6036596.1 malonate transporter subunit MadL [Kordiimonadaceae bacterium]MBT6328402.1 malonate transporter subunit MadL [Kordiimonadaceae bacterium]MBT7581370.1 malonate transporter subunit MadL [Kordiimonadaceae bacterium]
MIIYGVAILATCTLSGLYLGSLLGEIIGVDANVGGVGIAMLLLLTAVHYLPNELSSTSISSKGVLFWNAMYIPIVVAMAAKQNVIAALDGGLLALLAGTLAVVVSFALVPIISKMIKREDSE